jgi:hypothetical protein
VREFYFFLLVVEVPEVPGALLLANVFQFGREGFFGQALSPPFIVFAFTRFYQCV